MKLSIITINLNNAHGLQKTIESVVNQTFTDYEYIIIDGGSTDESVEVIKQYADKITYWVSEPDKGIYNAMNKGISQAKGEYLIFMNSGDFFVHNDILLNVYKKDLKAEITCGNVNRVFENGHSVILKSVSNNEVSLFQFYKSSPVPHQSSFIKRSLFIDEMYNERNKIVSDWEFAMKQIIFNQCSYEHLEMVIAIIEPNGISYGANPANVKERQIILEKYIPPLLMKDYDLLYKYDKSPFTKYIMGYRKSGFLEFLVYKIIKFLLRFYNWI